MGAWRVFGLRAARSEKKSRRKRWRTGSETLTKSLLQLEPCEERVMFAAAPQLISIIPNQGSVITNGETLDFAPSQLTLNFQSGQTISASSLAAGITLTQVSSSDSPLTGSVTITPGSMIVNSINTNEVEVRFTEPLGDGAYQLTVDSSLQNSSGVAFSGASTTSFSVDFGAEVTAVVPQPVTSTTSGNNATLLQSPNEIDVYFNNDLLNTTSAQNVANYELINTNNTLVTAQQVMYNPTSAVYIPSANEVKLTFASGVLTTGANTWRLRIGDNDPLSPAPTLVNVQSPAGSTNVYTTTGSSFGTAYNLGALSSVGSGTTSEIVTGYAVSGSPTPTPLSISNLTDPVQDFFAYPGSVLEPGHRLIPVTAVDEVPLGAAGAAVAQFDYNFQSILGYNSANKPYFNTITAQQEADAEEILSLWGQYLGVDFVQTPSSGLTIGTGDPHVVSPQAQDATTAGIFGQNAALLPVVVVNSAFNWGSSPVGGAWFGEAFDLIGLALGLEWDNTAGSITVMNNEGTQTNTGFDGNSVPPEPTYPSGVDIVNGQYLMAPDVKDVNMFQFTVSQTGTVQLETLAQRLSTPSDLQTVLRVFNSSGTQIAEDERYYGTDSNVLLTLTPGTYYVGVSSIGNDDYNPNIQDSGGGGTTQGNYELELVFTPIQTSGLTDAAGYLLDGDDIQQPGGTYDFWFQTETWSGGSPTNEIFVDKMTPASPTGTLGSITNPYTNIATALASAKSGEIVRIEGNSLGIAYEIGRNTDSSTDAALSDGTTLDVPGGVTVMIDAGAILKFRSANINVGTVSQGVSHAGGALQILGTPTNQVTLTSFNNTAVGAADGNTHGSLLPGNWGGIVFHADADDEANGVFLDYVNEATITYGGGQVLVNSQLSAFTPINITDSQPTISNNTILDSANAAMSADPNAFADVYFQTSTYTADYSRVGPNIENNLLSKVINGVIQDNVINGMFISIATLAGEATTELTVAAGWVDTSITYVLAENLLIDGNAGGSVLINSAEQTVARLAGSLVIAPGVVVKLSGARIETTAGTSQLIAEGTSADPIVFTSLNDDTYGAGGTFMTAGHLSTTPVNDGDWGGIFMGPVSSGSFDYVSVLYAGGTTAISGGYDNFNALEIDQARVRVADSTFANNAPGAGGDRDGLGLNSAATIYVLGAQPILLNNTIENNEGPAISADVNSLNSDLVTDWGRSTGFSYSPDGANLSRSTFLGNYGPVISGNVLANNSINGLLVIGGVLTTQVVFDDTSIVYVVESEITAPNVDTYGGLRIQSSSSASLVVKLLGATAGFTATGEAGDIDDPIGGFVDIVGNAQYPVILTSLNDNTVGAGLTPTGTEDYDTGNNPSATPSPGDWRSVKIDTLSNDNNFLEVNQELQSNGTPFSTPANAQYLGQLAPNQSSGDDTNRLGFEVQGTLYSDSDVDVYSFNATPGTQVWFDLDRSSSSLGAVIDLINADGGPVGGAYVQFDPTTESYTTVLTGIAQSMTLGPGDPGEEFSTNPRDPGMSLVLPGSGTTPVTYYVQVSSFGSGTTTSSPGDGTGLTDGSYQLQVRLNPTYQYPGSEVQYADIDYATDGVQVLGQPTKSPLIGNTVSVSTNTSFATAQNLGNLLDTQNAQFSVAGDLTTTNWYSFQLNYDLTNLSATSESDWPAMFQVSYADGLGRPDTTLALYDSSGDLLYIGRSSAVADSQSTPELGADSSN